jgi:hypothetical protein
MTFKGARVTSKDHQVVGMTFKGARVTSKDHQVVGMTFKGARLSFKDLPGSRYDLQRPPREPE